MRKILPVLFLSFLSLSLPHIPLCPITKMQTLLGRDGAFVYKNMFSQFPTLCLSLLLLFGMKTDDTDSLMVPHLPQQMASFIRSNSFERKKK